MAHSDHLMVIRRKLLGDRVVSIIFPQETYPKVLIQASILGLDPTRNVVGLKQKAQERDHRWDSHG